MFGLNLEDNKKYKLTKERGLIYFFELDSIWHVVHSCGMHTIKREENFPKFCNSEFLL